MFLGFDLFFVALADIVIDAYGEAKFLYAPELKKRCRPHLKTTLIPWRVDETDVKVKKVWMYLYRAVDPADNTLDFLISAT